MATLPSTYALSAAGSCTDIRERVENQAPMPTSLGSCSVSPGRPIVRAPHSAFQTTRLKNRLRMLLVLLAAFHLAACSKTVQWEEEVPLNTGETIWVKRTVEYSWQGGAGNPLDTNYRPNKDQTIEFRWKAQEFRYSGDARLMLLAISPTNKPVLVAKAADNSWYARHNYACTYPFYVQLAPDDSGRAWTWPAHIEPWLHRLPANLMLTRNPPGQMQPRYTTAQRQVLDGPGAIGNPSQQKIDPDYTGDLCQQRRKLDDHKK